MFAYDEVVAVNAYDADVATLAYDEVNACEADVAVFALPYNDPLIPELLIHLPAVVLYTNGCKLVGPDIETSDKPANV